MDQERKQFNDICEIYPPNNKIFAAFSFFKPEDTTELASPRREGGTPVTSRYEDNEEEEEKEEEAIIEERNEDLDEPKVSAKIS